MNVGYDLLISYLSINHNLHPINGSKLREDLDDLILGRIHIQSEHSQAATFRRIFLHKHFYYKHEQQIYELILTTFRRRLYSELRDRERLRLLPKRPFGDMDLWWFSGGKQLLDEREECG